MSRITAILPAAGLGTRMGAETPKQFLELEGVPIVMLSLRRIASCELITDIIVATRGDGIARLEEQIRAEKFKQTMRVVRGGVEFLERDDAFEVREHGAERTFYIRWACPPERTVVVRT